MSDPLREALDTCEWIDRDSPLVEEFDRRLQECNMKLQCYNSTVMTYDEMRAAMEDITGQKMDEHTSVVFPLRCDLGFNIHIGKDVLINYNCTFLDTASITIGDNCKIGPDCHLVTAIHPKDMEGRRRHMVKGAPISIGNDCWLGANVTVLPGIRIGNNCVIGAGSVVTKDVPDDSIWAGNPAHPIH